MARGHLSTLAAWSVVALACAPSITQTPPPSLAPEEAVDLPSEGPPTVPGALDADERAIFLASPEDDEPDHRGGISPAYEGEHYLTGNEPELDAFFEAIEGLGGGYMGVGSDQAYLFMDWARVDLAWLIDYDPWVQEIHELHRLFFLEAEAPRSFLQLWSIRGRDRARAIIDARHPHDRALRLKKLYVAWSPAVHTRLEMVARRMSEQGVPCYLNGQESYDFIRGLLQKGRVRPMLVDLLDQRGVKGIAQSAEALGVPIRVVYLSNAEQYWDVYTEQFRDNMASLPFDDESLILRTGFEGSYTVQGATNYLRWLAAPYIGNIYQIVVPRGTNNALYDGELTEIIGEPEDSRAGMRYFEQANTAPPEPPGPEWAP